MIRPEDFQIEIGQSVRGTFVRVTHKPTGNQQTVDPVASGSVGHTRDRLIAELRRLIYKPEDIRCHIGRSSAGQFIQVVHLPTGIQRIALYSLSTREDLLDEVLKEVLAVRTGKKSSV